MRGMWKKRLVELALAGGMAAAISGCGPDVPLCNANPDPCCYDPQSSACLDSKRDMRMPEEHD
jgi:hypothetical protein